MTQQTFRKHIFLCFSDFYFFIFFFIDNFLKEFSKKCWVTALVRSMTFQISKSIFIHLNELESISFISKWIGKSVKPMTIGYRYPHLGVDGESAGLAAVHVVVELHTLVLHAAVLGRPQPCRAALTATATLDVHVVAWRRLSVVRSFFTPFWTLTNTL